MLSKKVQKKSWARCRFGKLIFNKSSVETSVTLGFRLTSGVVGLLGVRTNGDFNLLEGLGEYADLKSDADPIFKLITASFFAAGDIVANLSMTLDLGDGLKRLNLYC